MKLRDFFYLQKSDRRALLFLLGMAVVALVGFFVVGDRNTVTPLTADDSLAIAPLRDTIYRYSSRARSYNYDNADSRHNRRYTSPTAGERFAFDPNTADERQLQRLGLRPWQVRNLLKYRAAGGTFRRPDDFARLYGLSREQYESLRPYIRISGSSEASPDRPAYESSSVAPRDTVIYPRKLIPGETVALNAADTAALKHVPGIGSGYAARVVRYRQRLGGFVSTDQLRDINGFPEDAISYFVLDAVEVRRININSLTLAQLKAHPYINFYQAKAITDYRRLHGPLRSLQQLRLLPEFSESDIRRLEPYIAY